MVGGNIAVHTPESFAMTAPKPLAGYQSYKNLPPLAGLCSIETAMKPGLSVEECVRRLKRIHYAFVRLHQILTARITAEPIYELKTAFAHHAYLCAEHVQALRTRVAEMREPPLGLEEVPHPALEVFFDEILCAPTTEELIRGLSSAYVNLWEAINKYEADTHPLTDAPSRRLLRFARIEVDDMMSWSSLALNALADPTHEAERLEWVGLLGKLLRTAGGLDGTAPRDPTGSENEAADHQAQPDLQKLRRYSRKLYEYDPIPQRDERFQDLWNQGVNAEAFLYSEQYPAKAKALMMLFKRLREIDVPEMMASIIVQTPGKPWGYYRDMTRQLWDEARHAMMGEVGFVALGVDWTQARITWNWSYRLNTECTPQERHAVLFFIEQGLMPRTGKRYEYEVGQESGLPLVATFQDFDWADEVLHSQIGRQWLVPEFGGLAETLKYGDECWSRILSNWTTVRDQGLTKHENWWPRIYTQACRSLAEQPDPATLAYDETYEAKRADIHRGIVAE
jgi:hypothetical protein